MTERHENETIAESIEDKSVADRSNVARRRFVKSAALALPAIATLRSGSAAALTSTVSCAVKNQDLFANNILKVGNEDDHLRDYTTQAGQPDKFYYVDPLGNLDSYVPGQEPSGAIPLTPSCYASLNPLNQI